MRLTIEIHDGWLGRPEDLRKILTTLAGLECPPASRGHQVVPAEPSDPEDRPRGRNGRYPGDDDRSQASHDQTKARRRTRRRTGGSSWAGPPSRCPMPRAG